MPAGELPDGQPAVQESPRWKTDNPTEAFLFEKFNFIFQKLCEQCCTINVLLQATHNNKEKSIYSKALMTTILQANTLLQLSKLNQEKYQPSASLNNREITELYKNCKFYCAWLWKQLEQPVTRQIRYNLIKFITALDNFLATFVIQHIVPSKEQDFRFFSPSPKPSYPSIVEQVTKYEVAADPYLRSLQENYYFPLTVSNITMLDAEIEDAPKPPTPQFTQTPTASNTIRTYSPLAS